MKDAPLGEMASEEDFVWLLCIKALPLLSEEHLAPESGKGREEKGHGWQNTHLSGLQALLEEPG